MLTPALSTTAGPSVAEAQVRGREVQLQRLLLRAPLPRDERACRAEPWRAERRRQGDRREQRRLSAGHQAPHRLAPASRGGEYDRYNRYDRYDRYGRLRLSPRPRQR
jgi:hypothetical protein